MITLSRVKCVAAVGNRVGENIVWCPIQECLYWTDIQAAVLWQYWPVKDVIRTFAMPERLCSFALCKDAEWIILGLASRLAFFHLPSGKVHTIAMIEEGLPTRLNDGACDREGRFVFGTTHEPMDGGALQPFASFYRLDPDLSVHRLALDKVAMSNAITFSPDGRTMYFCDSQDRTIQRCAYDRAGNVGLAETWVDLQDADGVPDGSTVDAHGGVWNAWWGMGRVVRYQPDGRVSATLEVPTPLVTCPVFGGADLETLYLASAHEGMTAQERRTSLQAGHVFAAGVGFRGLPEPRFDGVLPTKSAPSPDALSHSVKVHTLVQVASRSAQ